MLNHSYYMLLRYDRKLLRFIKNNFKHISSDDFQSFVNVKNMCVVVKNTVNTLTI